MISAGNDIVALAVVDKLRTNQPSFYSKFITPTELALHEPSAISFTEFVWLLWSVKESAYKYLKRADAGLVFSPYKIVVPQLQTTADSAHQISKRLTFISAQHIINTNSGFNFYTGKVILNSQTIYFHSAITHEFIATVVNANENFDAVYWGVQVIDMPDYESQAKAVRLFVLDKLSGLITSNQLLIDKHPIGYPVLYNDTQQTNVPISFAHHHRYVSYSFQISK